MNYQCDACQKPISRVMYLNGLRLRQEALCFVCQAVRNELTAKTQEQAELFNQTLKTKYGVTQEAIVKNKKLPYWTKLINN